MKKNFITILLVGLVVLNIVDGAFQSFAVINIVNLALLAVCLALNLLAGRKKG